MARKSAVKTQKIGVDIGRGFVKAFTDCGEDTIHTDKPNTKHVIFKAIQGEGKKIDKYPNPKKAIDITLDGEHLFIGELAEKECYNPLSNTSHSKTTPTARKLLGAVLSELATEENVSIILGVPYQIYTQTELQKIKKNYLNRTFDITNNITGENKKVTIKHIDIMKEANAVVYWELRKELLDIPHEEIFKKPIGVVNIGFRTTEISYFDKGFAEIDKRSGTIEFGNSTILQAISDEILKETGLNIELPEIDDSEEYEEKKKRAYENASERVQQDVEKKWINVSPNYMTIYVAGGTSKRLKFDNGFKKIKNAQLATAMGLYLRACHQFK